MKCIVNGKIILKDSVLENYVVIFDDRIKNILPKENVDVSEYESIDAKGKFVAPGLIDMHIHGYLGADASDGNCDAIKIIAEGIIRNGVTSWCPTTMTLPVAEIEAAFDSVREVKGSNEYYGARILGINCEGPFISPLKKGAQAEEHIKKPDAEFIKKHSDILKLFTVAPEVCGALDCIKSVKTETDVVISMGHTNATFEEAKEGISAGVTHTTHLFNVMTPLSHRNPGVVGAALADKSVSVEFIADTFHIDKGLFGLVAEIKKDKLCLITDCMSAGGMPDGEYALGGQAVTKKGIACRLSDGTIAGSVLKLNEAVRNLYENSDLEIYEAINCASLNPAKVLGEDSEIGSIECGKRADMIIIDEKFEVETVILNGEIR